MRIGEELTSDTTNNMALQNVTRGDVFRICLDRSNGITPKQGDISRNKFFVVLGKDSQGNIYGGVIINSAINQRLSPARKMLLMPVKASKYGFLEHDSFVDCACLMTVRSDGYATWQYKGRMDDDDVELITGTVSESPFETKAKLEIFGIV